MKLNLIKKLDTYFNDLFIGQNESNYRRIEDAINGQSNDLNFHKNSEKIAHSSNQIRHDKTTIDNVLNYQQERVRNLVLGVDGDGVKEVTDSRVSMDAESHALLSERLYHDFSKTNEKIEKVDEKFVEINFDTFKPDKTGETPADFELQAALDKIRDAGAGTLVIKNGIYLINKRLTVYSNTTIKMDENAVLLRGNTRSIMDFGPINEMLYGYEGVKNIHIIGGNFDCNLEQIDKYPTDAANMVNIRHADNVSFFNVKFRNSLSYHVLDINGVRGLNITNCVFEGYKNLNNAANKEAIQLSEIMEGGVGGPGAWDGTPCRNVVITGCTFRASDIAPSFDVAIGNHATIHNVYQENIKITNNTFEGCQTGVRPFKWSNVEISGNTFDLNTLCIRISAAKGGTNAARDVKGVQTNQSQGGNIYHIRDNVFKNYQRYAIYAIGEEFNNNIGYIGHIRINDNTFTCDNNDKGENIVLNLCRHVHIKGNNMTYSYRGIHIKASHNVFIDNNYIENIKTEGIYIGKSEYEGYPQQTNHLNITNNTINSTGKNGCYVQNSRFVYVTQNKILNSNLFTGDNVSRGGLYVNDCRNGRIEGNDFWGEKHAFAILGSVLTNFIAFNNGGSGTVRLYGENVYIGHYNVSKLNNIFKRDMKGKE